MKSICFVCHGNICRSPMAEYVMRQMVAQAGLENSIEISSAATSAEEIGNPIYPPAARELEKHGVPCAGHRARRLKASDYDRYDMIIGMDEENMRNMHRLFSGDAKKKLSMLLDHTDDPHEVSDPWYTRDFTTTYNDIRLGCTALLKKLR